MFEILAREKASAGPVKSAHLLEYDQADRFRAHGCSEVRLGKFSIERTG